MDTSDPLVMGLFSDEARRMITEEIPPLPPVENWFLDAMVRYSGHNNAVQFKDYIYTTPLLTDSTPLEERAGRIWLDNTMRCWSTLLDNPATFTRNHGEVWLTSNLWTALHDQCMGTVPCTYIRRGESKSMSTSDRKNSKAARRRRVGHLYDSVTLLDDHEIGAAEHSKAFVSDSSKKWTGDTLKVIKVLHDMLYNRRKLLHHFEVPENYRFKAL